MQTPHEPRICPINFEVQRSRSQCINNWKWFPAHNCFPFTPIIMKLHMQTPHESRMCPIDFEVKRSRSQCINYWKWFPAHNCFPFTPIIMKLHMQTPHESRMCPIDFEVKRLKVKVTMHKLLKMVSGAQLLSLYTYHHETSHADSPWGKDVPYRFWGQRSRSQCINCIKWFPAYNCFPFTSIIMKLHMQTPHEARMCPIDFEVKRSRSQCINYWKWFPAHYFFLFTPIIMKLHMQTPHESRMCLENQIETSTKMYTPFLIGLIVPAGVFVPLGQPRSSFCLAYQDTMTYSWQFQWYRKPW